MSNELIRKSDVLNLLNNTEVGECPYNCVGATIIAIHDVIEDMPPVNAVELPCEVGDTVYSIGSWGIKEYVISSFVVDMSKSDGSLMILLRGTHPNRFYDNAIGKTVFLTREEAEKALEDLKNEL